MRGARLQGDKHLNYYFEKHHYYRRIADRIHNRHTRKIGLEPESEKRRCRTNRTAWFSLYPFGMFAR